MNTKYELDRFWPMIKPPEDELLEIRFTDGNKPPEFYDEMRSFKFKTGAYVKNGSQLFIYRKETLEKLLEWNNGYFKKNYKICYGLNPRVAVDGKISGGYDHIHQTRFVFFDIDIKHQWTDRIVIRQEIENMIEYLTRYGLTKPILIHSGGGRHLLYRVENTNITGARKRWYKQFVTEISQKFSSAALKIDKIYDFTRVLGLPGSINVSRERAVQLIKYPYHDDFINHEFTFRSKQKPKRKKKDGETIRSEDLPEIRDSLEYVVLMNNAPQGERHQVLVFALKLLLKANGFSKEDVEEFEADIDSVYGGSVNLDPDYGTQDKEYHPGIVINWCKRNKEWVENNNEVHKKFNEVISK